MQSERLAKFIVKHNKAFLVALVVLLIISASLFYFALKNINYDITKYLPKGYYTDKCYEILNKYFSVTSDFEVAFTATEEQAKSIVDKIRSNSDVAFLLWYEDLALLKKLNVMTDEEFLQYETLFKKHSGGESFDYALIVSIKHSPSSLETLKVLKELKNIFFDSVGKNVSFSGLSELAYQLYVSLAYEIIFYIAAGVGIGILFLLIFTPSFIEPLIILLPVLFSIVINLGSHIIKPGLSIVAFIGSAILQLAVTLDFSSSFLICFKKFKKGSKTIQEALSSAVKLFFKSALPACLILMISALSLCAMKFTIGFDLGIAFAKGIVISFLTVLLSLPAVILMFNGAKIKTSHKNPTIEFSYLIKTAIKQRKIIACIFAVIFIISVFFGAVYINKTYLNISTENTDFSERQVMADTLSNQLILALPCNENLIDTHYLFNERLNMLKNAGEISFVLSVFSAIPKEATINVSDIIPINIPPLPAPTALSLVVAFINDLGDSLQPEGSGSDAVKIIDVAKKLISNGYTLYTVGLNCDSVESEKAFIILDKINSIASEVFYQNTDNIDFIYKKGINIAGKTTLAKDFKDTTNEDYITVLLVSLFALFVISAISFKSLYKAFALTFGTSCGLLLNLALLFGSINFLTLMLSTLLHFTATLISSFMIFSRFCGISYKTGSKGASYISVKNYAPTVLLISLILSIATLSIYFISDVYLIKEMALFLARSYILNILSSLILYPALLSISFSKKGWHFLRTPKLRKPVFKKF